MAGVKAFTTTVEVDGSMCAIALPFDPKAVFGKVRAGQGTSANMSRPLRRQRSPTPARAASLLRWRY